MAFVDISDRTRCDSCLTGSAAVVLAVWLGFLGGCQQRQGEPGQSEKRVRADPAEERPAANPLQRTSLAPRPDIQYVGSQACAECHQAECETYALHPMGQSLFPGSKLANVSSAFANGSEPSRNGLPARVSEQPPTWQYDVQFRDGTMQHIESAVDSQGETIVTHSVPIDFAIGSGQRGHSFGVNREGRMYMSPLSWYSQAAKWDLSPGYRATNFRFSRRLTDSCLNCHAGRMAFVSGKEHVFEPQQPFLEHSIGCERCHGPGAAHITARRQGSGVVDDSIVNPVNLTPAQRDHVCFQCHLSGQDRILRAGRSDDDFRPGDLVTDIWTIFSKGSKATVGRAAEAVSQVEQMLTSRCYTASDGGFGCVSCHDPHSVPRPSETAAFYRSRCMTCHDHGQVECSSPRAERLETSPQDSCIQCHMPRLSTDDVPHTAQTDHRVLRDPQQELQRSDTEPESPLEFTIYGAEEGLIPADELARATALKWSMLAEVYGVPELAQQAMPILQRWHTEAPDDRAVAQSLGASALLMGRFRQAGDAWLTILERFPEDEEALSSLLLLCEQSQQFARGVEYGKRLIAANPWEAGYRKRYAAMLHRTGRVDEAVEQLHKALELDPSLVEIHVWLEEYHRSRNEPEQAARHRRLYDVLSELK